MTERQETESAPAGKAGEATETTGTSHLLPVADWPRIRAVVGELALPYRGLAWAAALVMVAATAVELATAPLLGHIVDLVADGEPASAVTTPAVLLVAVAAVQGTAIALGLSLVARLGETVLAGLRERVVARALRLPMEDVEKAGSGDLTSRVTADVSLIAEAVRRALPELVRAGLAIVLTLGALAILDWRFLLAALLAVPVQAHTARWYIRRAVPLYAAERVAAGERQQQLLDTIGEAATVRAFGLGPAHRARVAARSSAAMAMTLRGVRLVLRFYSRLHIAEFVGLTAILATGFVLVGNGSASIGTATAAALYFHALFGPMNTALVLLDDAQSAGAGLARLVGVADLPEEADTEAPAPTDASVAATALRHAYEPGGREVLCGVDIAVAPGEHVAVVGASGAGKTTLAKLVAGVHTPTGGSVAVGGVGLGEFGARGVRRVVALVTQEVYVFSGPLADDLRLARPDASDAELRAALARVGALGWAEALPDGLATVVGTGGHALTGAQAQQLALARLVLADPPVAILDEATAEAGSSGARALEHAAEQALDGRTALVVAHRLSQASAADRVVVMDRGRVVETGTHDELRAAGGVYATLWAAWSGSRAAPPGT